MASKTVVYQVCFGLFLENKMAIKGGKGLATSSSTIKNYLSIP